MHHKIFKFTSVSNIKIESIVRPIVYDVLAWAIFQKKSSGWTTDSSKPPLDNANGIAIYLYRLRQWPFQKYTHKMIP